MNKLACVLCFLIFGFPLWAQPVIAIQPINQVVLGGLKTNVTFSVSASGQGPLTYQWLFNGTNLPNNLITTVAGNGNSFYSGDGGPATNAALNNPGGIAEDGFGNVYIADINNNRIRLVNTNGIITTIAGTNSSGFFGDGGPASNAGLSGPYGVCADAWGNYYIADSGHARIRRVDTNGIITTVAGTNTSGFFGDGGPATNAALSNPRGVSADSSGNLFIADYGNNRIRKVDTNGIISTVAGTNMPGYSGDGGPATVAKLANPAGVAVDAIGNLYIADYGTSRIRWVDTNGFMHTIAGTNTTGFTGDGGAATNARIYNPAGIAVDSFGNIYFSDSGNSRVRQIDPNGLISTVAGNGATSFSGDGGAATNATLSFPYGLAMDSSGGLVIADEFHYRIRKVTLGRSPMLQVNNASTNNAGSYQVVVTSPAGSVTSSVVSLTMAFPAAIVTQPQSINVTNGNTATLSVTTSGTGPLSYQWYLATNAVAGGTNAILTLASATPDMAGNYFCVVTNAYGAVTSYIALVTVLTPPAISVQPTNQTVVAGNNVLLNVGVSGTGPFTFQWRLNGTNLPNQNNNINLVAGKPGQTGTGSDAVTATNSPLLSPAGVTADSAGDVIFAEVGNSRVRIVTSNGIINTLAGVVGGGFGGDGATATNALLSSPSAVTFDTSGNLYIADTWNNRIRKVDTNGIIITIAGTNGGAFGGDGGPAVLAHLYSPTGVAADNFGNLFIADSNNNRIRKVDTNGIITTVAGTNSPGGLPGFAGDGGPAVSALIYSPNGLAVDGFGNLYISDYGNWRIRKVDQNGIITTVAGTGISGYSGDFGAATNANISRPEGVAVDAYGDVFIADYYNYRIRMVDINGTISTVAGNGSSGYSGGGGVATNAGISYPTGVGLDAYGNPYLSGSLGFVSKVDLGRAPFLQLNKAGAGNIGNYDVIVTSPYGSVTSSVVSLSVLLPPVITAQSGNTGAPVGGTASLSVTASNYPPFGYQWFMTSGRAATAIPVVSLGRLQMVVMFDSGIGYSSTPAVHIAGGGGSGATAIASVLQGRVYQITVMNSGSGYIGQPTVQIDPPSPLFNSPLPGQTNSSLTFSPVALTDGTNYFVVVTNAYGSVTSRTAALWAFLPPQNFAASASGSAIQIQLSGTAYWPYVLQSTTNLAPPIIWQSIYTNQADGNGNWSVILTNLTALGRYYRGLAN